MIRTRRAALAQVENRFSEKITLKQKAENSESILVPPDTIRSAKFRRDDELRKV
jgi:hypothetical protein